MKISTSVGLILVAVLVPLSEVGAFECYKCNSNEHSDTCVQDPKKLPVNLITECTGYCTIVRTEYTDIPGVVVHLTRDCESKPLVLNGVRTDKHYTKMYTSCNTGKCNEGDGKREPGDGDGGWVGPKNVIVVNEQSSGRMMHASFTVILLTGMIICISKLLV